MATNNSGDIFGREAFRASHPGLLLAIALLCSMLPGLSGSRTALASPADNPFAARMLREFNKTRAAWLASPTNTAACWNFGRASFDWAEFATNDTQRAAVAEEGIRACRQAVAIAPNLAQAHYYLGMNLGQLARTQTLGAIRLVSQMETSFIRAKELDASFDFAGPDRCLGLLYLDAPGWPASIGDKPKAREHLESAQALAPDHPENRLNLLEALVRWRDKKALPAALAETEKVLASARSRLTGEEWEASWADWNNRFAVVRVKIKQRKLIPEKEKEKEKE